MNSIFHYILCSILELSLKVFKMEVKRKNIPVVISMFVTLIQQINGKITTSCYKNDNFILTNKMTQGNCTDAPNPVMSYLYVNNLSQINVIYTSSCFNDEKVLLVT